MADFSFRNEFLNTYLHYVEETESPRIAHVWSAITCVAACMGRRVWLPEDIGDVYPNMYTFIVGPPSVKKSTAMNIAARLVKDSTEVRFAPDDTGGQRQGLLTAMQGSTEGEDAEFASAFDSVTDSAGLMSLADGVDDNENSLDKLSSVAVDIRDRHTMFVTASEVNSFIGHNNFDMLTFLIRVWDGDDYEYQLKSTNMRLKKPLLSMIGCTTPTNIAEAMPAAAMGQGFMSRVILVYGDKVYKKVRKPKLVKELEPTLKRVFSTVFNVLNGPMEITKDADGLLDELYSYRVEITDPRFVYYIERRFTHLRKLAMVLAAARLSNTITIRDVEEAHIILAATEIGMPDALGEYGLSPLAASKQKLIEFITMTKEPLTINVLWAVFHREMKHQDFMHALADLQNAGKVMQVSTNEGPAYVAKLVQAQRSAGMGGFAGIFNGMNIKLIVDNEANET